MSTLTMDSLSNEMLVEIFEWLPGKIRREARLICQRWNQVCLSYTFIKNEKFVLSNGYDLNVMAPRFEFRHRKILNLHFVFITLLRTDIEISFWRSCGDRVESINLIEVNCNFMDLKRIIEFCPNLKCIELQCHLLSSNWLDDFDAFADMHFIAPSVTTFHFKCFEIFPFHLALCPFGKPMLTNYVMSEILAMFPNLEDLKLEFKFDVDQRPMPENLNVRSKQNLSIFGLLFMICGVAKNLKKLYLKANADHALYPDVTTLLSKLENIEELSLIPSYHFVGLESQPFAPLLKLTKITSLRLAMGSFTHSIKHSVAEFISIVLLELTNLRHLYMDLIDILELNEALIQSLVNSALKTLLLGFRRFELDAKVEHFNSSLCNRTLKTVSMFSRKTQNFERYACFFKMLGLYFCNVIDITVAHPNDLVLQRIFRYQKRLKRLRLESCHFCTDFGFTGLSSSNARKNGTHCISELSNLEYLRIKPANRISEKTFSRLILPKLKTLELVEFGDLDMGLYLTQKPMHCLTKFESLMKNSPLLEVLKLHFWKFVPQEEMEEMLRPFKQLRHVKISDRQYEHMNSREKRLAAESLTYNNSRFFEMCPLLRKVVHNDRCCYLNVLTKELVDEFPSIHPLLD